MSDKEVDFYAWEDCPRCNGTGYIPVADCLCARCKRRYVRELEQLVLDNGDNNDYTNPLVVCAVYLASTRNKEGKTS